MAYDFGERIRLPDGTRGSVIDDNIYGQVVTVVSFLNGEKRIRTFTYQQLGRSFGGISPSRRNSDEIASEDISRLRAQQEEVFGMSPAEKVRFIRRFQEILMRREDLRGDTDFNYAQRLLTQLIRERGSVNRSQIAQVERQFEILERKASSRRTLQEILRDNNPNKQIRDMLQDAFTEDTMFGRQFPSARNPQSYSDNSNSNSFRNKPVEQKKKEVKREKKEEKKLKRSLDF